MRECGPDVDWRDIETAYALLREYMFRRIKKHGPGPFISIHEAYGVLAEEFHELMIELINNDKEAFIQELLDIAVGAIFAIASLPGHMHDVVHCDEELRKKLHTFLLRP